MTETIEIAICPKSTMRESNELSHRTCRLATNPETSVNLLHKKSVCVSGAWARRSAAPVAEGTLQAPPPVVKIWAHSSLFRACRPRIALRAQGDRRLRWRRVRQQRRSAPGGRTRRQYALQVAHAYSANSSTAAAANILPASRQGYHASNGCFLLLQPIVAH